MSLQSILNKKLENIEPIEILKRIGYRKITDKTIVRLKDTLSDELLGLDNSHFDFKYSNIEYIKALCRLCDVDFSVHSDELDERKENLLKLRHGFKTYVFVYTDFKRDSQPIIALAFMEQSRHLSLPVMNKLKSIDEQVEYVQKLVINHYETIKGHLDLWGEIKHYVFNLSQDEYIVINTDGTLSDALNITQNRATVSLGNKHIALY